MRNTYLKLKVTAIIMFIGFFTVTVLNSCDKTKQFDDTTWVGKYDGDEGEGEIILSFSGDQVKAALKIEEGGGLPPHRYESNLVTYTYEKKKMRFTPKWKDDDLDDEYDDDAWSGTVDKTSMKLNNVLGESVTFKKQ
ncbi:MAG: hypothetical protein LBG80_13270 [Bacteroidales bacterium]|jgi:hypothetical protein|nr:hypothetical protein [Bacteroidales bacterium]